MAIVPQKCFFEKFIQGSIPKHKPNSYRQHSLLSKRYRLCFEVIVKMNQQGKNEKKKKHSISANKFELDKIGFENYLHLNGQKPKQITLLDERNSDQRKPFMI